MTEPFADQWPTDVSRKVGVSAYQECVAAGYESHGEKECTRCGQPIRVLLGPSGKNVEFYFDGSLHVNCRAEREPVLEPLPPVPTLEDQQATLDRLLGKK
jgi:hypothetical protein